jgi:protein-disulfide isomerase
VGDGPVRVDIYIDYLCPFCKRFELNAADALAALTEGRQATLVYHPMNFLDEASTTRYPTRAAAASGCAADGGRFAKFSHLLYVHQPAEGGPGLSDGEIGNIGRAAGLDPASFTSCVGEGRYLEWPAYVTAQAVEADVQGTPTVRVAGTDIEPDGELLTAAVLKAQSTH